MNKLLVLYTSPIRKTTSASTLALDDFITNYKHTNPEDEITVMDLNEDVALEKNLTSQNFLDYYGDGVADKYIEIFNKHDKIVFATSTINFKPSPVFISLINRITIARKTFNMVFDAVQQKTVSAGKFVGKKAHVLITMGSIPEEDIKKHMIDSVKIPLEFIGFDVSVTLLEGMDVGGSPEKKLTRDQKIKPYENRIADAAIKF
ncbi:hypothetical protein CJJ23_02915 [Mycoplasmopsis agassizii]|uniref:Flavodoxin-like fold domain-containing protein n=1 Tax=Mycoplasmopsis agassizii TaxID=33922 RepID=A0A269TIK1_9BACT|nr:NAD(P)H-dependent oxidoreductase [Mycoplasmopsis agassizii]PAK21274.1 hypothetical protein CJJ23_02915 [Mycoplasmopsis agassizii]